MSRAVDDLRKEHDAILLTLSILEKIVSQINAGGAPARQDLEQIVGFLKEFADRCHHGKEEGILFPEMKKAGVPERGGPLGVMLAEHDAGRGLIAEMTASLASGPDYRAFASSATRYIELLRSHIAKENNVLFPMAERVIPKADFDGIYLRFEEHEEKVIGKGRHEELHGLLKDWKGRYLA